MVEKLLLTSPGGHGRRCWWVCKGVATPKYALRCFFPQGSLSIKPNNRGLVDGHYPILWPRPHCRKLPQPCTPCCCLCLALLLFPFALSLWCPALAMTHEKRHESSTCLVTLICRFAYLLGVELWKIWRILPLACDFVWS